MSSDFGSKIDLEEQMYNESTYFEFELYTIHVGSINSFGGSKVPIYWQRFFVKYYFPAYIWESGSLHMQIGARISTLHLSIKIFFG